ncbi:MAG TPA: homocysteine biosynthesis protein [Methanobacteriaceae archaeon]|nr:homocysteine biosynthesis protein [Methanobacteriaceae archaeon]
MKTIEEINQKIKDGNAVVVTAAEMTHIVRETGAKEASKEVDVVTTGTFGAMCSSGVFLNFGHSDPPIKMARTYINGVEAYSGLAAVDAYLGATQPHRDPKIGIKYGGSHLLEDLVRGNEVELVAEAYGTDCYPLKNIHTHFKLEDLNQAIMVNPRNSYQNYAAATNSSEETLYTYLGTLLPKMGNVTYSSAGELSPLLNDPYFKTMGLGTRIFLCGTQGYILGEGTQHNTEVERKNDVPVGSAGTLMLKGDLKKMDPEYLRGATMPEYGPTLYVGAGIPIPILNEEMAKHTGISDQDITCRVMDYGVPRRSRPAVLETNYHELKTGSVEINGREIQTSPLSSYRKALQVAEELKKWIDQGKFFLSNPVELVPSEGQTVKPLQIKRPSILVRDLKCKPIITATPQDNISDVARLMVDNNVNHLPVIDTQGKLMGIVTSWDIAHAVAKEVQELTQVMTKKVIVAMEDEPVELIARRIDKYEISGVPIVDRDNRVKGMITAEDISRLVCSQENKRGASL